MPAPKKLPAPKKRRTDGMGGGSVGPTPEPSWNPWTPPPTTPPRGGPGVHKLPGELVKKPRVRPTPTKVGGRIFDPVGDGGRREPKLTGRALVRYKVADIGPHLGQGYKYSTKTVKTKRGR